MEVAGGLLEPPLDGRSAGWRDGINQLTEDLDQPSRHLQRRWAGYEQLIERQRHIRPPAWQYQPNTLATVEPSDAGNVEVPRGQPLKARFDRVERLGR